MPRHGGATAFAGGLGLKVLRPDQPPEERARIHPKVGIREPTVAECMRLGLPQHGLSHEVNRWRIANFANLRRGIRDVFWANRCRAPSMLGFLHLTKIGIDGKRTHYGLAGARVVTDAFVNNLVDQLQGSGTDIATFDFHGIGLGTTAEAAGDTDIETELTTQYQTDNTRATGTPGEGATANIYQNVGTNQVDASVSLREHGLLTSATVGSGILADRSVYALISLISGESLQSTYELTCTSGG